MSQQGSQTPRLGILRVGNLMMALGLHLAFLLVLLVLTGHLELSKSKESQPDPLNIEVIRLAPSTPPSQPSPGPAL